jgi:hypothetical protein
MRLTREFTCRFAPMPRWPWRGTAAAHKTLVNNNENTSETVAAGQREWPDGTDFIQELPDRRLTRRSTNGKRSNRDQALIKQEQDPRELSRADRLQIVADSGRADAGIVK